MSLRFARRARRRRGEPADCLQFRDRANRRIRSVLPGAMEIMKSQARAGPTCQPASLKREERYSKRERKIAASSGSEKQ
jgi:hypothetical protein